MSQQRPHAPPSNQPRLLDQVRTTIRLRGMSYQTEKAYADWIKRFIIFHNKGHPKEMGAMEIRDFLAHLVNDRNVAPSTQNQTLHSLLFLYRATRSRGCQHDNGLHPRFESWLAWCAEHPE